MKLLVISDIHGNYDALKAILQREKYDEVLVLGDLVDYGPEPELVIDELKDIGAKVLRGNHDHAVAFGVDCGCGSEMHELSVYTRENITLRKLGKADIKWLASLPPWTTMSYGSFKFEAYHASPYDPLYGYLFPWSGKEELIRMLSRKKGLIVVEGPKAGTILVGHTHYQFTLTIDGIFVVNPGSVGQPRDGIPRAAYCLIDTDMQLVTFGRIDYDVWKVIEKLRAIMGKNRYFEKLRGILLTGRIA